MLKTLLRQQANRGAADQAELAAFLVDGESRAAVEQACSDGRAVRHHVAGGNVQDATAYLRAGAASPRLLIVDITGLELPLSAVDGLAEVCEPDVRVIVVGDRQDIGLFRALLKLGVADYLIKPLSPALLAPHLGGEAALAIGAANARSGKLVVVTGACGGVGATTVAANLGWHLAANDHRRVALVDLDLYGQSMALQLDQPTAGGLLPALRSSDQIDPHFLENAMTQVGPRLGLLNGELDWSESLELKAEQLGDLIGMLERQHHYVIVDLPRRPGAAYTFLMRQADFKVVVTNRTLSATRDCGRMLELDANVGGRSILVLNEDRPSSRGMLPAEAIETALGRKVEVKIAYQRPAGGQIDQAAKGQPLLTVNAAFAQSVAALAGHLNGRRTAPRARWHRLLGQR